MECIVCLNHFDLQDHRPIKLTCMDTMCISCAQRLDESRIVCPKCREITSFNDSLENHLHSDLEAKVKKEQEQYTTNCSFHLRVAVRLCPTHMLPLCETCLCLPACKLELIRHSTLRKVKHFLRDGVMRAVDELQGEDHIPQNLKEAYSCMFDDERKVEELLTLYKKLNSGRRLCYICFSDNVSAVVMSSMEFCCAFCKERLPDTNLVIPLSQLSREEVVMSIRQFLQTISFWHLSLEQVSCLHSGPDDIQAVVDIARTILTLKDQDKQTPNHYFYCPGCRSTFGNTAYRLLQLPCPDATHALCQDCVGQSICPLDLREFDGRSRLPELMKFTPDDEDAANLRAHDGKLSEPRDPFQVWNPKPNPKPADEGHELAMRGIPVPPFQPEDPSVQVLERFHRVLPENPQHYQEGSFEEPWYVGKYKNQVEALTFRCFKTVILIGIGLANPLDPERVIIVDSVGLYTGAKAEGSYHHCECCTKELRGPSVVTDIYFAEGVAVQQEEAYTLKLKLQGATQQEQVALYHGNHIGRFEDGQSSDGTAWCFEHTLAVKPGERNSGQHDLISPILRLIYTSQG